MRIDYVPLPIYRMYQAYIAITKYDIIINYLSIRYYINTSVKAERISLYSYYLQLIIRRYGIRYEREGYLKVRP